MSDIRGDCKPDSRGNCARIPQRRGRPGGGDRVPARADRARQATTTSSSRSRPNGPCARRRHLRARYREGMPLSPLDGVPIGWKDLIDVAGSPTTAGSALFRDAAAEDARPRNRRQRRCRRHGVDRQAQHDRVRLFGPRPQSALRHAASIRTIAPRARSPGGSSSGCGAAVAARLLPVRHRLGHGRFGAHPGGLQRRRRLQDQPRPDRCDRRRAACRARSTPSGRWRASSRIACLPTWCCAVR